MLQRCVRALVHLVLGYSVLTGFSAANVCAQEGGIEVFAAETLFETGSRLSLSHIFKRRSHLFRGTDRVSDPLDRTFEEHRVVAGFDHGILPELTLSALVPIVHKELRSNTGDVRSSGLGDIVLLAKYRIYKEDWYRSAFIWSVAGGLEVPSGETGEKDGGVRLAPELQPGLGSWNPFLNTSLILSLDRWRFDGSFFLKVNTEGAQDFEKGDFFSGELSAAYRFLHTKYPGPTASARLGVQWRHESRDELNGTSLSDSGVDEILLRPGITLHPIPSMDVTLSVDIPIYQDFNGDQLGLDFRTIIAVGLRF